MGRKASRATYISHGSATLGLNQPRHSLYLTYLLTDELTLPGALFEVHRRHLLERQRDDMGGRLPRRPRAHHTLARRAAGYHPFTCIHRRGRAYPFLATSPRSSPNHDPHRTLGNGEQMLNAVSHAANHPLLVRGCRKLRMRDVRWLAGFEHSEATRQESSEYVGEQCVVRRAASKYAGTSNWLGEK